MAHELVKLTHYTSLNREQGLYDGYVAHSQLENRNQFFLKQAGGYKGRLYREPDGKKPYPEDEK